MFAWKTAFEIPPPNGGDFFASPRYVTAMRRYGKLLPPDPVCSFIVLLLTAVFVSVFPSAQADDEIEKHIENRLHEQAEEKASGVLPAPKTKQKSWQLFQADDFLTLPSYEQELYVSGLSDAYNWSYSGGFDRMKWLVPCVTGRKAPQLTAMFRKWLERYPERWHEPAAKLFPFAIFELCRASGQPLSKEVDGKKSLKK